jgi:endonuclease/exonuclease/phosphatase family metal-dependent hydrolase
VRIISLNIWQGKLLDPLMSFIKREAPQTDIFCFQEMISSLKDSSLDIFSVIKKELPDFQGFFESVQDGGDGRPEDEFGLALFIRKADPVDKEGDFFVYRTRNAMVGNDQMTFGRNFQFVQFPKNGKEYTVVNFHGLADRNGREDSDERIDQSNKLKEFLAAVTGLKIVCGDFNLTINTKSLAIIDEGMRNLIKEFGITSTRNHYFPYPDKFCDYILIDKDVKLKGFAVLDDEISDHLALRLDWQE